MQQITTARRSITEFLQENFQHEHDGKNQPQRVVFRVQSTHKVIGEPSFDKLLKMFRKLKANTAAVPCTLCGGANGYLGMLVSSAQYNIVAPVATFVPPPMPGTFVIDPSYMQYQIAISKTKYETALREHHINILMHRSLIALIQQAVEYKYTNAVSNCITGNYPRTLGY